MTSSTEASLCELFAVWCLVGQPRLREGALCAYDALSNCGRGLQESARDLFGGEAADHAKRERCARLARQERMARSKDETQHLVADVVVECGVEIGHRLLLLDHVGGDDIVLACAHAAASQVIQSAVLGGRHQPSAGALRYARGRPRFERGQ